MRANVAAGKKLTPRRSKIESPRASRCNRFEAKLHVIDAFARFRGQGHPHPDQQPQEHTIWRDLAVALEGIEKA